MPPLHIARVIWAALLGALATYLVVLVMLLPPAAAPADVTALRLVLAALVLPTLGAILFFRRQLPSPERASGPAPPPLTTYVVCWALAESIALYGLVLGLLAHSLDEAEPFFILGAALLLWQRPRAAHFGA